MEDCTLPDPEFAVNFFSLVRIPDQPDVDDWATDPPVNNFTTGFLGKTDTELRRFPTERIPQMEHGQTVDKNWVAVLDERSMSTETVVLHNSYARNLWDKVHPGAHVPAGGEVFGDGRIWWKWRVPFKHLWTFYNSFESDPTAMTLNLYTGPELHKDEVVDMDTVQKIMDGEMTIEDLNLARDIKY